MHGAERVPPEPEPEYVQHTETEPLENAQCTTAALSNKSPTDSIRDWGTGGWGWCVGHLVSGIVLPLGSRTMRTRVRPPPCWAKCRDGEIECSGDMCLCTCQLLFCVRAAAATETAAMAALAAPLIISITQSDAGVHGCTRGRQARTARAGMSQSNRQGCGMSSASLSSVGAKTNTHSERRDGVENRTHTETASTPKSIVDGVLDIELRLAGVNFELR